MEKGDRYQRCFTSPNLQISPPADLPVVLTLGWREALGPEEQTPVQSNSEKRFGWAVVNPRHKYLKNQMLVEMQ